MIEKKIERQKTIPFISTSDDERDFSSPERVAYAIEKLALTCTPKTLVLNVCSGRVRTVKEQVQLSYPEIPAKNYLGGNSNVPRLVGSTKLLDQYLPRETQEPN
jgi:hypothetical protein